MLLSLRADAEGINGSFVIQQLSFRQASPTWTIFQAQLGDYRGDLAQRLRFWPGTEAKLVDTNDGATYAIKGESLNSTTGTAYPMMSERPEVVVDAMTFTIYPMGMADVESRANAWEVKMNTKGYIQKFGPADKSTEPVNLIETRTQESISI